MASSRREICSTTIIPSPRFTIRWWTNSRLPKREQRCRWSAELHSLLQLRRGLEALQGRFEKQSKVYQSRRAEQLSTELSRLQATLTQKLIPIVTCAPPILRPANLHGRLLLLQESVGRKPRASGDTVYAPHHVCGGCESTRLIHGTTSPTAHLIPGANRAAMDRLDDAPVQLSATQAQPEPFDDDASLAEMEELFEESDDPDFHELEPARALFALSRGSPACRVTPRGPSSP